MADEQFFTFLLAAFKNIAAHMAEGGSAYVFHADTEGLNFSRAFKESGFHISGVCIWVKNSLVLGRSPYQWQHEPVLYGWLPNGKHKWFADRKQSTIWNFDKPKKSADHPTMKPIPLLCYAGRFFSPEKEPERILCSASFSATIYCGSDEIRGGGHSMNEETKETQESSWQEAHPWLSQMTSAEDQDDSVGEVIRYTLDELRFA
jgi:hypothetical protein